MYRKFLFLFIMIASLGLIFWSCSDDGGTAPKPTQKVKIISPNGGEVLQMGQTVWVKFDNDLADPVDIFVYKGQDSIDFVDVNITLNDSVAWLIPNTWDEGFDYKLKIVSSVDPTKYDFSDSEFIIAPAGNYIMVTSPNGGGIWLKGSTNTINWITNITGTVRIDLYKNSVPNAVIYNTTANDGTQGWSIPGTLDDSADYQIQIQSIESPAVLDMSDNFFCIASNDNTQKIIGDWRVSFSKQPSYFYFNSDGTLTTDGADHGKWKMTGNGIRIDDDETSTYLLGIVEGNEMEGTMLTYDGYKNLWEAERVIPELYSPNGGQVWMRGTTQTITWNPAIAGNVVLSLADKAGTVRNIATVAGDLGTYDWAIPSNVVPGTDYVIRIHKEINTEAKDESVSYICISENTTPDIIGYWYMNGTWSKWETIWQFNSDGTWTNNFTESGNWTLTGNGLKWTYNSGSPTFYYFGLVENDKVSGTMGDPGVGNAGTWFGNRILTVLTPNGGGFYEVGDLITVTWYETLTAENITVDLYENDVFYRNLGSVNVNNFTSFNWTVPSNVVTSTKYKIRLTSTTSDIYDESDDYFTIDAVPASPAIEDETFDDGAAENWSVVDGTWTFIDSFYKAEWNSVNKTSSICFNTEITGNYMVEARCRKIQGDFYYGIILNGDHTNAANWAGMWNSMQFMIDVSGGFWLAYMVNGSWNGYYSTSTAINAGLNAWNVLKVIVNNDTNEYHLFANDQYIVTVTDTHYNQGEVGLLDYSSVTSHTEFDYVKISPVNKSAMDGIKIKMLETSEPVEHGVRK